MKTTISLTDNIDADIEADVSDPAKATRLAAPSLGERPVTPANQLVKGLPSSSPRSRGLVGTSLTLAALDPELGVGELAVEVDDVDAPTTFTIVTGDGAGGVVPITAGSSVASNVSPIRLGPAPTLPAGVLAKGANLIPDDESYVAQIQNWATSFPNKVKPRLDLMAAHGLNIVRLAGGLGGIVTDQFTRAEFQAAMGEFVEYAAKVGICVYAQGADVYGGLPTTYDASLIAPLKAEVVSFAAFLDKYPNVVALDLFNEFFYDGGFPNGSGLTFTQRAAIALDWSTAVRAVTNIPITWSLPTTQDNASANMWNATAIAELAIIAPAIDFVDMHIYYDVQTSDLTNYLTALATLKADKIPLLIGECGITTDNPDATRASRLARVGTIVNECQLVGGMVWDLVDNSGSADQNMGIFHQNFTPYPLALAAVKGWPTSLSPKASDVISSDLTIYGSLSGSDSNDGLSSAKPKTLAGCCAFLHGKTVNATLVIQLADGTTYGLADFTTFLGTGMVILRGNSGDKNAVKIERSGAGPAVLKNGVGVVQLEYIYPHGANDYGAVAQAADGGTILVGNGCTFGAEGTGVRHLYASNGGKVGIASGATYYIEGGADSHIMLEDFAFALIVGNVSINCGGSARAFVTAFVNLTNFASMKLYAPSGSWSVANGSITGVRWLSANMSILKTFGAQNPDTVLPGNSNGSADAATFALKIIS